MAIRAFRQLSKYWPFVTKTKYRKLEDEKQRSARYSNDRNAELNREIEELLKPMVEKFSRVRIVYDPTAYDRYMIQTSFDTRWIERCLLQGDSQVEISYLADAMTRQIRCELEVLLRARNIIRVHRPTADKIHYFKE